MAILYLARGTSIQHLWHWSLKMSSRIIFHFPHKLFLKEGPRQVTWQWLIENKYFGLVSGCVEFWIISQTGRNPPNLQQWRCSLSPNLDATVLFIWTKLANFKLSRSRGIYFAQIYWARFTNPSAPALFSWQNCASQKNVLNFPKKKFLWNGKQIS